MNSLRYKILLIEDDAQIQRFLTTALEAHDYELIVATLGAEGIKLATTHNPDIVILDLGLPDISGMDVIRRLREWYTRPIIILSAREQESDKVAALDLGANDYVTKPFGMGELLARLRVAQRHLAECTATDSPTCIDVGGLSIDLAARRVLCDGKSIHLTPIEYRLLIALAQHRDKVVTHRHLLLEVWGPNHVESPQYLRMYMRALRNKIESDLARPRYLHTETGVGYRLSDVNINL